MSRYLRLQVLDKGAQFLQATEYGDVERVKQMVAESVDVNIQNEVGMITCVCLMEVERNNFILYFNRRKKLHCTLLPDMVI